MKKSKLKIIFVGTPEFGAIILEKLIQKSYKPILIVTAQDKPSGRKQALTASPVKIIAQKYNIAIEQPDKIKNLKLKIQNSKPDLAVLASYGKILPKEILEIPKYGCLNVHPSLLPKYRGAAPVQFAILNGDEKAGVTIMLMDEKMDHGPILAQREINFTIKSQMPMTKITYQELHNELAKVGAELLIKTIPQWLKEIIKPRAQNESRATYTKILKKEDGKINWQKPAEILEREIRAFYPWPGSWTIWQKQDKLIKIKILKARIFRPSAEIKCPAGKVIIFPENNIGVKCKENFLIIEKLQIEGKKEMTAQDFLRGNSAFTGAIFG